MTRSSIPLVASALLLAGLCLFQAGRRMDRGDLSPDQIASAFAQPFGGDSSAHAGMVSQVGGYTVLTAETSNEDLVMVLDDRNEQLFIYRFDNTNAMQLVQRLSVSALFTEGRSRTTGRSNP
jgi:hypothetical protein